METDLVPTLTPQLLEQVGYGVVYFLLITFVASFVIERSLSPLFSYRYFKEYLDGHGIKYPMVLVISYLVCKSAEIDFMHMVWSKPVSIAGTAIAVLLCSGGSKRIAEAIGDLRKSAKTITAG